MKKLVTTGIIGTMVLGMAMGISQVKANEEYIAIPSAGVREAIIGDPYSDHLGYGQVMTEEEINNLNEYHYLPKDVFSREIPDYTYMIVDNGNETSLEGLQNVANMSQVTYTGIINDPEPLKKIQTNDLTIYPGEESTLTSVDFMADNDNMQTFTYWPKNDNGTKKAIVDISALQKFTEPGREKSFNSSVNTIGEIEAVRLSKRDRNYTTYHPVNFGTMEGSLNVGTEDSFGTSDSNGKFTWTNIPEGTESLHMWVGFSYDKPGTYIYYTGQLKIPIIWVD